MRYGSRKTSGKGGSSSKKVNYGTRKGGKSSKKK